MGGGLGVGRAVEWSAAAGLLASGTEAARAAAVEGGCDDVEWSEAVRASAIETSAARVTEAGGRKGRALASGTAAAQATAAKESSTVVSVRQQQGWWRRGFSFSMTNYV